MSIYKDNSGLPISMKISNLNDMILELEGLIEQAKFNLTEISSIYSGSGLSREFLRNVGIGNTLTTYVNWSHVYAQDSYSIWKYTPENYEYNSANQLYFDNKIISNKGEADAETALSFDKVFLYNGGYVDNTAEAGTAKGTPFELMSTVSDYLYLGCTSKFQGVSFTFDTRGSNYTLFPEIYNSGSGWTGLTAEVDNFNDRTSDFVSDGRISWDLTGSGAGWGNSSVNSQSMYWVRFKTITVPVTVAEANAIQPANSVITLLLLSSEEVIDENWAWCSYGGSTYVTIRNKGVTAYEGDYYITTASSDANKQNYFVYNHEYTADHENSTFDPSLTAYYLGDRTTNNTWRIIRSGSSLVFDRRESGNYITKSIISA